MSDQAPNKQLLHLVLGGELSRIDDIEFKDLVQGRRRRRLSELRDRLCGLAREGAADRGQCADALFHRPSASPARSRAAEPGGALSFAEPGMLSSRRLARARWVQKTIGILAAEYLRFVNLTSRTVTVPGDIYERAGRGPAGHHRDVAWSALHGALHQEGGPQGQDADFPPSRRRNERGRGGMAGS